MNKNNVIVIINCYDEYGKLTQTITADFMLMLKLQKRNVNEYAEKYNTMITDLIFNAINDYI